jgi:hypothetical protein
MINPVQPNLFIARSAPPVFNEGAASTASKVAAFITTVLASLASFVFLPAEAALSVSLGIAALLAMLCCAGNNEGIRDVQPRRWFQPIYDAPRTLFPRGLFPVVNPGPRVPVGGNHQPFVAPIPVLQPQQQVGHQEGPRAPVGHGHRAPPGGIPILPQAERHQLPPVAPVVAQRPAESAPAAHRVPVGHRA